MLDFSLIEMILNTPIKMRDVNKDAKLANLSQKGNFNLLRSDLLKSRRTDRLPHRIHHLYFYAQVYLEVDRSTLALLS